MTRNKYNNKKTIYDGFKFDSLAECARYKELKILLLGGFISDLKVHPPFVLVEGFRNADNVKRLAIKYIADFQYYDIGNQRMIYEDVKGVETAVFRIKRKLFEKRYNEVVTIVPVNYGR